MEAYSQLQGVIVDLMGGMQAPLHHPLLRELVDSVILVVGIIEGQLPMMWNVLQKKWRQNCCSTFGDQGLMVKTLNFYGGERMTEYVGEMEAEMCEEVTGDFDAVGMVGAVLLLRELLVDVGLHGHQAVRSHEMNLLSL